jgi:hypothetical protein
MRGLFSMNDNQLKEVAVHWDFIWCLCLPFSPPALWLWYWHSVIRHCETHWYTEVLKELMSHDAKCWSKKIKTADKFFIIHLFGFLKEWFYRDQVTIILDPQVALFFSLSLSPCPSLCSKVLHSLIILQPLPQALLSGKPNLKYISKLFYCNAKTKLNAWVSLSWAISLSSLHSAELQAKHFHEKHRRYQESKPTYTCR